MRYFKNGKNSDFSSPSPQTRLPIQQPSQTSPSYVQYTHTIFETPSMAQRQGEKPFEFKPDIELVPQEGFFAGDWEHDEFLKLEYPRTADCHTRSKWIWCPHCSNPVSSQPNFCGDKIHCPICARVRATELGDSAFERLMEIPAFNYAHIVLTLSPMVADRLDDWYRGDKWEIRNYLFWQANKWLKKNFPTIAGALMNVHSWSSKKPLSSPHWHVHILVPLVDVEKTEEGYKLNSWKYGALPEERLEELRVSWGKFLDVEFLHIHWEFTQRRHEKVTGKLRHWCKYLMRTAILDINKFLLDHPIENITADMLHWLDYHVEWRRRVNGIEKRYRANRWYGFLSDGNVGEFFKKMFKDRDLTGQPIQEYSLHWVHKRRVLRSLERHRVYCPYCYQEIPAEAFDSGVWGLFDCKYSVLYKGRKGKYGGEGF